jgi:hypothetical protein
LGAILLTIGVLSWGAYDTLKNTLESYERYKLPLYDPDRVIFFQEISEKDIKIAEWFGYKYIGAETNVGIAEGYKRLVAQASGTLFLFLENDWELVEYPSSALADVRFLISTNQADVVKLRHRAQPGNPLWTRQFENKEYNSPAHLLDSIHWKSDPSKFKEIERVEIYERSWYTTTSKYANWSNNPHMAKTQWLKNNILPQLGTGDIEKHMQLWWEQQDFKVAQGNGLFTHNRLD